MDKFNFVKERPKRPREDSRGLIWKIGTAYFIFGALCLAGFFLYTFIKPNNPFNPFPPEQGGTLDTPVQPTHGTQAAPVETQPVPIETTVTPTEGATSDPIISSYALEIIDSLTGLPFDEFIDAANRQLQLRDPDNLIINGYAEVYGVSHNGQFTNLSVDYLRETEQLEVGILDLLRDYDRSSLSTHQKVSYDTFEWYLDVQVQGHTYICYKFLVNTVWGLQNFPIDFLNEFPLESKRDAEDYIAYLSYMDTWGDQVIERLRLSEQVGAIPPKLVLEETIDQIDAILNIQGGQSPEAKRIEVYLHLRAEIFKISDITEDERDTLFDYVEKEIEDSFIPAYQALKDHLVTLTTIAVEDPNQWRLPGGEGYYNYLLTYMTGTNLTADEIHALGLVEVFRIQDEIKDAAKDLGLPDDISMVDLNQRISEESSILTGNALLEEYEQILAAADEADEDYFDLQPSVGVTIRKEIDGPPAYYEPPKPGSGESGEMPVNLDISPQLVNYNEHVLVHHETIPGHHTQIALAQDLEVPKFQRYYCANPYLQKYVNQAYVEGWAWYAEGLAWEMGLYEDEPWANLGRLRLHLLRAVRIVVDTGIHAKGWTLDEAADYLEAVTGMPQSRERLIRYLVNPGYPSGYFIGWVKLMEMRQRAMDQLGDGFDIKEFHNTILGHGVVPIGVMDQIVTDWIDTQHNP